MLQKQEHSMTGVKSTIVIFGMILMVTVVEGVGTGLTRVAAEGDSLSII